MIKKVKYILFFIGLSCNLWSETNIDNPKDLYAVELSIYDGPSSLLLDWRVPGDINPKKINIYRKSSPNDDFDLTLEFKQESNGNSGVFIRSTVEGTKVSGWQVEVAPPGNDTGGVYESYGRGWLIKPEKEKDKALKMGEWNTMRIRVVGDQIESWLNDTPMIKFVDEKIGQGKGSIALQIHDGGGIKVRWRNLFVTPL